MCILRSPYFDNFQNKKNFCCCLFVLISFRNLVRSIHPTTCRSMFSEANACARVARSGVNWRDPCFIHLRSPEQFEKMPCLSGGYELSIDKNVKKTNGTGSRFRRWTRTEYRFDIGVEGLMSQGLQLKKLNCQLKNQ